MLSHCLFVCLLVGLCVPSLNLHHLTHFLFMLMLGSHLNVEITLLLLLLPLLLQPCVFVCLCVLQLQLQLLLHKQHPHTTTDKLFWLFLNRLLSFFFLLLILIFLTKYYLYRCDRYYHYRYCWFLLQFLLGVHLVVKNYNPESNRFGSRTRYLSPSEGRIFDS